MSDSEGERRTFGGELHHRLTQILSLAMVGIGVAFLVEAVTGASPYTVVFGVLFVAGGAGRLYMQSVRRRRRRDG